MKISDISPKDVAKGGNWSFVFPDNEEWEDDYAEDFEGVCEFSPRHENVIYSGLVVLSNGEVIPTVTLTEVDSQVYGGDSCWFVNGRWVSVGRYQTNINIEDECFANPLDNDAYFAIFADINLAQEHKDKFKRYVAKLNLNYSIEEKRWDYDK